MRRRALLASIVALSGCNTNSPADNQAPTPETTPTDPSRGQCPPAPDSETQVECSDSTTQSPIRMTTSPSTAELPRDTIQCTLHNESERRLSSGFGDASLQLFAHTKGNWELIEPKIRPATGNAVELQPGETREWNLVATTANLGSARPDSENNFSGFPFRFLPGKYAFGCRLTSQQSDSTTLYTTTFSVSGDTPQLLPSDSVDTHSRQGTTLTVNTQTAQESGHLRRVSLLLERDPLSRQTATLSLFELYNPRYEQVPSYDQPFVPTQTTELLRDAFALEEASDNRIIIHTTDVSRPPLGMRENEPLAVRYNGSAWTLTTQNGWE